MKKLLLSASSLMPFLIPANVLAQAPSPSASAVLIKAPEKGYATLGNFVTNVLVLAFGLGILVVLVMLIWGAFEWITSGGDKEAVGKARSRIINALIGLAVLAVAFALARVAAQFLGFDLLDIVIPTPNPSASGL